MSGGLTKQNIDYDYSDGREFGKVRTEHDYQHIRL